jgi:hypothetical protein
MARTTAVFKTARTAHHSFLDGCSGSSAMGCIGAPFQKLQSITVYSVSLSTYICVDGHLLSGGEVTLVCLIHFGIPVFDGRHE